MAAAAQLDNVPVRGLVNAMFDQAPIGIGYWDAELRYRRVKAELAAMDGLPIEAHIGRRPSEVLPELGPKLEELFGRILRGFFPSGTRTVLVATSSTSSRGTNRPGW